MDDAPVQMLQAWASLLSDGKTQEEMCTKIIEEFDVRVSAKEIINRCTKEQLTAFIVQDADSVISRDANEAKFGEDAMKKLIPFSSSFDVSLDAITCLKDVWFRRVNLDGGETMTKPTHVVGWHSNTEALRRIFDGMLKGVSNIDDAEGPAVGGGMCNKDAKSRRTGGGRKGFVIVNMTHHVTSIETVM